MGFFDNQHKDHLGKYSVAINRYISIRRRVNALETEAEKAVAAYQARQDEPTGKCLTAILNEAEPMILLMHEIEGNLGYDSRQLHPTLRLMMDSRHLKNAFNQAMMR